MLEAVGNGTGNGLANTLIAKANASQLLGLGGDDTLRGGPGTDTLNGGAGNDSLVGGRADDTYIVDSALDRILERQDAGTDLVIASVALSLGKNLENLTLTGGKGLSGTGNGLDNAITGNRGANLLSGRGRRHDHWRCGQRYAVGGTGADWLEGDQGADRLVGGAGDDYYVLDNTGDRVIELTGV